MTWANVTRVSPLFSDERYADSYLPYLVRFLRPAGQLGVATPGTSREVRELGAILAHIKRAVGWEAIAWHTAEPWGPA
ncbi:hypothetical protein ACWGLP_28425 [Streptomyces lydicus]